MLLEHEEVAIIRIYKQTNVLHPSFRDSTLFWQYYMYTFIPWDSIRSTHYVSLIIPQHLHNSELFHSLVWVTSAHFAGRSTSTVPFILAVSGAPSAFELFSEFPAISVECLVSVFDRLSCLPLCVFASPDCFEAAACIEINNSRALHLG